MIWVFLASGVLAIVLSVMTVVLSQRQERSGQLLKRWAVAAGMAWVLTIAVLCVLMILFVNGFGRI
jgi:hypothetical protein